MPIHDQGYRRYGGTRAALGRSWQVIAASGARTLLGRRAFVALLLVAWVPFLVRAVQIYVAANFPQTASLLAISPSTFREFIDQQGLFVFFVTIYAGAGLIANDRRANALQLYLSRPLTRAEYVAGKLAILLVFLAGITWVPAMLLLLVQVLFAGSFAFVARNLFLLPAITLYSLLVVLVSALTILALSSLSKSSRFVGIMYAGVVFFTAALYQALRGITGRSSWAWLSPTDTLEQLGAIIFRLDPPYELSAAGAIITVVVLAGASCGVLARRVRAVEVVT
jgi:ABC-2 type transport system permease protein